MHRSAIRLALILPLVLLTAAAAPAAEEPAIPLDSDGLPAYHVKQWTDFPVRLELADEAAVKRLLRTVEITAFSREDLRYQWEGGKPTGAVVETRVTEAEFASLLEAGYRPEKLRDVHRENRQAMERLWADMSAGKASGLRTDPLNYVPTNDQLGQMLQDLAATYPDKASYFTWGTSVQGRTLHGLVISDNPLQNEAEPEVRLSSTMHGDEIVGTVLTVNLAHYLLENYGQPGYEDVTAIVDDYELHLMPAHNPDGTHLDQRYNANGVDLNRNFPEPAGTHPITEIENLHFIDHAEANHFVISINYHGGALVMNYPWDYTYTLTPDDAAIQELALEYSTRNLPMYNGAFSQGITNGAQWYVITGSVQDWSYDQTGCIDITCEVSNIKWPSNSSLPGFWEDNRESMLAYVLAARSGISGVVTDAETGQPLDATVTVVGIDQPVHTDPANGDYYKLLHDGTFDVTVAATGYVTQTVTGVQSSWGTENVVDVQLQPLATGLVSGTVTDLQGQGLDATVEVRTWPAGELVETVTSDASEGGAFALEIFQGDYTLTASAPDYFTESQQVTVGEAPVEVTFELGGMVVSTPILEDFEQGQGGFGGDRSLAEPGHDSQQALTDSDADYPHNADLVATHATGVSLVDVMEPEATFMAKWSIENSWDAAFFEVSTDGGNQWTPVAIPGRTGLTSGQGAQQPSGVPCFDGDQANWVSCLVDLSAYVGEPDVRFRFRLATDGSVTQDGFWVDDFQVQVTTEDDGGTTDAADVPTLTASVRAYPNPFNPQTTLRLVNPRAGHVEVGIYDVQGRLVRTLASEALPAGPVELRWDGATERGRPAGSGVYFARLRAGGEQASAKLMLIK